MKGKEVEGYEDHVRARFSGCSCLDRRHGTLTLAAQQRNINNEHPPYVFDCAKWNLQHDSFARCTEST